MDLPTAITLLKVGVRIRWRSKMKTPYHYFINFNTGIVISVESRHLDLYRSQKDYGEVVVTTKPKPKIWTEEIALFNHDIFGFITVNKKYWEKQKHLVTGCTQLSDWQTVTFTEKLDE